MSSFRSCFCIVQSSLLISNTFKFFPLTTFKFFLFFNVFYLKILLFIRFSLFCSKLPNLFLFNCYFVRFSCCLLIFYFIITVIFVFTQISSQLHLRFISLDIFHHWNVRLKTSTFSHEIGILVIIYYVLRCLCFEFTLLFTNCHHFSVFNQSVLFIYIFFQRRLNNFLFL